MIQEMQELLTQSEALLNHLKEVVLFKENRQHYLTELKKLLDNRQAKIDKYQWARIGLSTGHYDFNEDEKKIAKTIIEIDKEIVKLLKLLMNQHQTERRNHFIKGKSMVKYFNLYNLPTRDGVFFDKKK